ncbi:DNA-directed RNA polymerase [Vibrio parahaemolyticus]|uniref:DNA-directed RNA polymerase n=1 Tax=Vibrio parahaemolyticus TaxID=670 RepID=UPI0005F11DA2|nr:DNA-directed RNA polymerase [Vibrio parahaemolyticus]KJR15249.1 hypothetical protein UF28_16420 [Vibrio parahaemolyticus]
MTTINTTELLKSLIETLKAADYTKEEIFHRAKVAQSCLVKAQKYQEAFSRKVFKSPTMLVANYGSKQCTTTEAVQNTLHEVAPALLKEFSQEELNTFCRLVHLQVGVSIPASNDYLKWSSKLMYSVAKKKDGIAYNHPLTGFPVNIRENKEELTTIQYKVFAKSTKTQLKFKTKEVNPQKTATTAVPSIIHSTDAAILDNTKERFNDDMALVHDSFGTSPNKLNSMNTAINESLLDVAKEPVMQEITDQLTRGCEAEIAKAEKKSGLTLMTAPMQNTLKGSLEDTILNSTHAFS